jgi:hypothetical protein
LQLSPYYQCGLAALSQQSKTVKTLKFTSKGKIAEEKIMPEEEKK